MATLKRKTASGYETLTTGNKIEFPVLIQQTGITPTGAVSITQNGTYDVTNYASANVAIPVYDGSIS